MKLRCIDDITPHPAIAGKKNGPFREVASLGTSQALTGECERRTLHRMSIRLLLAALTMSLFLGRVALAVPPSADPIPAQIASLPWAKSHAEIPVPAAQAQIAIKATYGKPGLITDTDVIYMALARSDWGTALEKSLHGRKVAYTKVRSFSGGDLKYCRGQGEVIKADKAGFDFRLELDWRFVDGRKGKFKETFRCAWGKEQSFTKDGFTVALQVAVP